MHLAAYKPGYGILCNYFRPTVLFESNYTVFFFFLRRDDLKVDAGRYIITTKIKENVKDVDEYREEELRSIRISKEGMRLPWK